MATPSLSLPVCLLLLVTQLVWATSRERQLYIVHMDASVMPRAFNAHQSWYDAILSSEAFVSAADEDVPASAPKLVYAYDNVISGFSAVLTEDHLELLRNFPGFVAAYPDVAAVIDTTYTYKYLGLNHVSGIWPESKYGKDIIIGVVDTGIWPESESFKDEGMVEIPKRWRGRCEQGVAFNSSMCNRKLIGARYFNKGLLAQYPNITISMNSSRDTDGHGTYTASTAAGNYAANASYFGYATGTARGVAPRARIASYKVFWSEGNTGSDILAGVDQAITDGVDVISISLSYDRGPLYKDAIAIASFAAMEKGILVSASAGNTGPSFRTVRNGIPWILTTGASIIDRKFAGIVTLSNGVTLIGSSLYVGNRSIRAVPLYFNRSTSTCSLPLHHVKKKVVVCELGDDLWLQTSRVAASGGVGVLFVTNSKVVDISKGMGIPTAVLNLKDSGRLKKYVTTSKHPTVSMKFLHTITGTKPAPAVAKYSSRGPSFGSPTVLKPDVIAPGSLILAAWPPPSFVTAVQRKPLFSSFDIGSGTSVACPHASGLAALLKSVHPHWSPAAIRSAIMTTADTLDNTGAPIQDSVSNDQIASPLVMGSGQISPNKAVDPGLVYDADGRDYVRFLCALNYTREQLQTITKNSEDYDLCRNSSLDLNYPSFIAFVDNVQSSGVHRFKRTVTNVGLRSSATYTAKLTPMNGFKVTVVPDKLIFRRKKGKATFTLTVEANKPMDEPIISGSLSWVDDQRKHVVRSPIVITTIRSIED
ncbi:subtilisin-like protease SBT3 [Nymphaea colorata]|nr:subtilisin-like protease SBT3 [Nymphaea colorata]